MTAYKVVYLACDWPGCSRHVEPWRMRVADAEADAAREYGWVTAAGVHLCGPTLTPDDRALGRKVDQAHATAGHVPATKRAGAGVLELSCSCGWVRPERLHNRGVEVRLWWADHIREVLTAVPAATPSGGAS